MKKKWIAPYVFEMGIKRTACGTGGHGGWGGSHGGWGGGHGGWGGSHGGWGGSHGGWGGGHGDCGGNPDIPIVAPEEDDATS